MPRLKRFTDRAPRKGLSVPPLGMAFLATGTALFAEGVFHGELAATLSGAAIMLFFAFSAALVGLAAISWRTVYATAEWHGLEYISIKTTPDPTRPLLFPWLTLCDIRYSVSYREEASPENKASFVISSPITRDASQWRIDLPPRGSYLGSIPAIVIMDVTHIVRFYLPLRDAVPAGTLTIPAKAENCAIPELPSGLSGTFAGKSTFRRSDELYEARQYRPGDDPRKMNWKVFAHTGNLSIREGELLPPPSAEYALLVNPLPPLPARGEDKKASLTRYETLVSRAAFIALWLLEKRRIVTVIAPTRGAYHRRVTVTPDTGGGERAILDAFAHCRILEQSDDLPPLSALMPEAGNMTVLVFTTPEQPLPDIALNDRGLVLIGPTPERTRKWSARAELLKCVFLYQEQPSAASGHCYQRRFSEAISKIKKEGRNAQGI